MQIYCAIGTIQRRGGNRKLPIHSPPFAWPLSKPTTAVRVTQEEEPHLVLGETRRRNLGDPRSTSNDRWMVVWSSAGFHPRGRIDHGCLPTEVDRGSSQALRRLVRVWRREAGRRTLWNWMRRSDMEGQNGGRMLEVGARMFSGGCKQCSCFTSSSSLHSRELSYITCFPSVICSMVVPLVHFVLL